MSWFVVHFPKEDSVAAIPSTWYLEQYGQAVWPPENVVKRSNVIKYIRKRTNPEKDWPSYSCIIWGKYDNFKTAQKKAKRAEKTKNLTSTGDEERGKGFRKKKSLQADYERRSSSSRGDDSETDSDSDAFPQEPDTLAVQRNPKDNHSTPFNLAADGISMLREESPSTNFKAQIYTPTATQSERLVANKEADICSNCNCTISSINRLHRSILRELYLQSAKLNDLENLIRDLTVNNLTSTNNNKSGDKNEELMAALSLMPVDEEKLLELEEFLTKNRQNSDDLIEHLKLLGGSSCKEITKRILYKVFTDEAGLLYSWEGAKKKKVFKNLKIANVIIESVRKNQISKTSTDHEIITVIKQWLVKCQSRINNKKKNEQGDHD